MLYNVYRDIDIAVNKTQKFCTFSFWDVAESWRGGLGHMPTSFPTGCTLISQQHMIEWSPHLTGLFGRVGCSATAWWNLSQQIASGSGTWSAGSRAEQLIADDDPCSPQAQKEETNRPLKIFFRVSAQKNSPKGLTTHQDILRKQCALQCIHGRLRGLPALLSDIGGLFNQLAYQGFLKKAGCK